MNHFLLSLAALLILVLSALFAAPYFIDWNDYRPVFETQATKLLGRKVKVGGEVHLVLLPVPELRFDDVEVADAEGRLDKPLLEAKSIEALLNIGALMTGTIEARKLTIADPVLRLELNADGTGNWSDIGRPGEALPVVSGEVLLDSVSVTGGRIELVKQGAPVLALDDVAGEASAASLSGPYKVSTTYSFEGRRQDLKFSTSAPGAGGRFHLKSALRDPDRDTVYLLDGEVAGLGDKPAYDGNVIFRTSIASAEQPTPAAQPEPAAQTPEPNASAEDATTAADAGSGFELKGQLNATADRAELPAFELTLHAKGHPQLLKGKLALDFGEHPKTDAELSARFLDVDALLADAGQPDVSPATMLSALAEKVLAEAAAVGTGSLAVTVEQASLGGDLVGDLDLALTTSTDGVKIGQLKAKLPGDNRIEATGLLTNSDKGPIFTGPIKLEGSKLRTLTRWASGDRDMSGQTSVGAFTLTADATLGGGDLKLENASGELSDTKFKGSFSYRDGKTRTIELALDSDRLDLKEVLGEDVAWRSWLPASAAQQAAPGAGEPNLLAALRNDNVHVALRVGELLLPSIPPGKLDANFSLAQDTLDVASLDFTAEGALKLTGKGRIEHLSEAPSGRVDFALNAANADSLRVASGLIGLPDNLARSKNLASLAPLDIEVGLVATGEGHATKASLVVSGKAGGSDLSVKADASGEPAKLDQADIGLVGSVTGERPQALLGLLLPDMPQDKLSAASGGQGKLSFELHGVPKTNVTGRIALETPAMTIAFDGQGALKDEGMALTGKGQATSPNAAVALLLLGLETSPGATGVPLNLRADVAKTGSRIELKTISGEIAGEPVQGSVRFDVSGDKTSFSLDANAGKVSLPILLGSLVAWQRTPSTEDMLGAIGSGGASETWPARGFALGPFAKTDGEIKLAAKTLSLGAPFQVQDATLLAHVDGSGLKVTTLKGRLFGGTLAASGSLSPRGAGAALDAKAELVSGKLEELSNSLVGSVLAKGPFGVSFNMAGEGLSPPGLVAGLSGEGALTLQPGTVQALSEEPLKRVAFEAAKTKKLKDKEQIASLTKALRDKLTHGTYKYDAVTLPFEIKNGTLKLKPSVLASKGAATTINGYIELASLRLDSEWEMRLQGNDDLPSVSLVFAGPLSNAAAITPAIDTDAVDSYLTVRRMQEDVERLETLDVSGRTPPPPETKPEAETEPSAEPVEPEPEAKPIVEAKPTVEAKPSVEPKPRVEAKTPAEAKTPVEAKIPVAVKPQAEPAAPPAPVSKPDAPSPRAADLEPEKGQHPPDAASKPTLQDQSQVPAPPVPAEPDTTNAPSADGTTPSETAPTTTTGTDALAPATPKPHPHHPPAAPDDWKKGVGIFGGG